MSNWEALSDEAIVYRALLRQEWINEDTRRVKADAYFLRLNEPGLSVNIASVCSPEQCAGLFRKCYGVASLQAGYVREIGLDKELYHVRLHRLCIVSGFVGAGFT